VCGVPELQAGLRGTLAIDGTGCPLPFVIKRAGDGELGLAFEADAAAGAELGEMLERCARRAA